MPKISGVVGSISHLHQKRVAAACLSCGKIRVSCPTGIMTLVACPDGMHRLDLLAPAANIERSEPCHPLADDDTALNGPLESCVSWLKAFFDGDMKALQAHRPPLCPNIFNNDSFRSKVWCTLEKRVKFGETVSYGELAQLSGSPRASQAVGSAMRNNPVSLVVPCHRVILSSGKAGNYSGGQLNDTKVWLLNHEKTS